MRTDAGQGSVEWVGLVAAIATFLFVGSALAQAPFVSGTITRQLARALCIVRGGDCERDREPCTTRASGKGRSASGLITTKVVTIELGAESTAALEYRSDGTLLLTEISAGSGKVGSSGPAAVALGAAYHGGRSWLVRSEAEADELLRRIGQRRGVRGGRLHAPRSRTLLPIREPDIVYNDVESKATVRGSIGKGSAKLAGGLSISRVSGTRVDRQSGERTVYFKPSQSVEARVVVAGKTVERRSEAGGDEVYSVVYDRTGAPRDLQITATTSRLPDVALPFGGMLRGDGRRYETTTHLDLTDPVALAAVRAVLGPDMRRPGAVSLGDATRRLRELIDQGGTVEVRAIEQHHDKTAHKGSIPIPTGRLGAGFGLTRQSSELVAAASRGLDGQWLPRDDCVART